MLDFFEKHVSPKAESLHFIKDETVREWILASNVVISSYSTTLIEAAVASRPSYMAEPIPIPDSLQYDWYQHVPRVTSLDQFKRACLSSNGEEVASELRAWAEARMLSNGDPISNLADLIRELAANRENQRPTHQNRPESTIRRCLAAVAQRRRSRRDYFNRESHEKDVFEEQDVKRRVERWRSVLFPSPIR